jgi:hypothetical protein
MARWGRIFGWSLLVLLVLLVVGITATIGWRPLIGPRTRALTDRAFEKTPERLERGRYLATNVVPCVGCHSLRDWKLPGAPVAAGNEGAGHPWADEGIPWLVAPNITPDRETGAGSWTDDMIARAVREGIGHDGRALFPLMPYEAFRALSDEDLASIIVYIRSLEPRKNALPKAQIPFPVSRLINSVPQPITDPVPQPDMTNTTAYGGYLVRIAACADCHSPMDAQGQRIPGLDFAGGSVFPTPLGEVASANLTPAPSGIPYYNEELFIEVMRTGQVKARKLHPQMPWILYGGMTDADLKAMFAYIRGFKPVAHTVDNTLPPTQCALCGLKHGGAERNHKAE